MKAIVNVNKASAYANLNGLAFKILSHIKRTAFTLDVNGVATNFNFSEVIIQDFQAEYQKAYDSYNWGNSNSGYLYLKDYANTHKIEFKPEYNCPA